MIVADERGRYQFRHALLREVVHDDLLPGEHAELHLALARALEHQAAAAGEDALITAGIAHHYLSAGAQREALGRVRPRRRRRRARARPRRGGGAARARARPVAARARRRRASAGCRPRRACCAAPAARSSTTAPTARAEALLRMAVDDIDEDAEPRRGADLLELLSRAQWSLGRATDSRDVARPRGRAAARGRPQRRARADPRPAGEDGDAAGALQRGAARRRGGLRRGRATPAPTARRPTRSTRMGHSQILLGQVEDGSRAPARGDRDLAAPASSAPARGPTSPTRCTSSAARRRGWPPPSRGSPTPPPRRARE